jgi:hypothetical protein
MSLVECPHCYQSFEVNHASELGKIKSNARNKANAENAKKPRPGAKGKAKPRKAKEVAK